MTLAPDRVSGSPGGREIEAPSLVPTSKPTKAQFIARQIADDIAAGRHAPGTALDETEMAARYKVSRTPIREAIRQLTAQGMLTTRPHLGAVVRAFGQKELDDMFAVMADLEALCARGAARAMTTAELNTLEDVLGLSAEPVGQGDRAAYAALNERFHDLVYQGAHNPYLVQLTRDTQRRLAPFRQAQFDAPGRLAHSLAEHQQIVAAIRSGDAGAAFEFMRAHIVVVRDAVDTIGNTPIELHTT